MNNDKRKILIVEDEAMVAMVMSWSVEQMGYIVCATVATGEDAVEAAATSDPDLILMDVHLPGRLNGIDAAKEIATTQDVPFIFFTGYSEEEVAQRAHPIQPVACLSKPVENRQLRTILAEVFKDSKGDE